MKLSKVIVTYNSDDANMQTVIYNCKTDITLMKLNIPIKLCIYMGKTGHISSKPHCNTTIGKKGRKRGGSSRLVLYIHVYNIYIYIYVHIYILGLLPL